MLQRHISHYQQFGKLLSQTCAQCSGRVVEMVKIFIWKAGQWALMLQRHISPYQQLGELLSQTCALCFWVVEVVKSMRKANDCSATFPPISISTNYFLSF
jgi:hypothetical protein